MVAGVEFIQISNCDREFAKWVSNSTKGLRNNKVIEHLKRLRTDATKVATMPEVEGETLFTQAEVGLTQYAQRKHRKRVSNSGDLPEFVLIDLPGSVLDGVSATPLSAKTLTSFDAKFALSLELNVAVLDHLKGLMRSDDACSNHIAFSNPVDGIVWLHDRKAFQAAKYTDAGGQRKRLRKTFKPASTSAEDMDTAKAQAAEWQSSDPTDDQAVDDVCDVPLADKAEVGGA